MTVDELLRRVYSQPTIVRERLVYVPGPQLQALLAANKPLRVSEIEAHPDQWEELRRYRYGHVVGRGLARSEVEAWQAHWRQHVLPPDLVELLTHVNGIHLWADLERSRAYFGISRLAEWKDAARVWAGFEYPLVGQLVMSYHENGDYFLVLDTRKVRYLWYDLEDFGHPKEAATTVEELLDWWWENAAELDPRAEAG